MEAPPRWEGASALQDQEGSQVYLLALDESGTHGTASCLVIAGLAIHELDARPLADVLEAVLAKHLSPLGLDSVAHELHSADLRDPSRGEPARGGYGPKPPSEWLGIERRVRNAVIDDTYDAIATYQPVDPAYPPVVLGAVIERKHRKFNEADEKAYNHVLHRFDDMLLRLNRKAAAKQQGIVLHDRRLKLEQSIQDWARKWQRTGSRLDHLALVPVFADSKASRLLQAADFVAYGIYRSYSQDSRDPSRADLLWPLVDTLPDGRMSGVIHLTPSFDATGCQCRPCASRLAHAPIRPGH